jgi:hypothetical protein
MATQKNGGQVFLISKNGKPTIPKKASLCFPGKNIWNSSKNFFLFLGNMQRLMAVSPFSILTGERFKEYQQQSIFLSDYIELLKAFG